MSAFPPGKWQVRHLRDMDDLECAEQEDGGLTMEALVAIKPSGGEEGSFKLMIGGTEKLKLSFPVSKLLPGDDFNGMLADIELWAGAQIKMEKNSCCSEWWDVEGLVTSQDVVVNDGKGRDMSEAFLTALQAYKAKLMKEDGNSVMAGIALRWTLGTKTGSTQLILMAQVFT